MKPQPMSESEIVKCLVDAGCIGTIKMTFESGPYDITRTSINADRFARAIEARVNAQWAAMIGEPVAWELSGNGHGTRSGPALWLRAPTAEEQAMWASFGHPATVSPLYAIKETP